MFKSKSNDICLVSNEIKKIKHVILHAIDLFLYYNDFLVANYGLSVAYT